MTTPLRPGMSGKTSLNDTPRSRVLALAPHAAPKGEDDKLAHLTRESALNGSPDDCYNYVQKILIPIPQYTQGMEFLQSLLDATGRLHDPNGIAIMGESGTGKSVLCNAFAKKYPVIGADEGYSQPVLLVEMEQKIGPRSLLAALLRSLGYPFTHGQVATDLVPLLAEGLRTRGVKLVLFDEGQESGEGQGKERPKEIGNVLKRVFDKSGVAQAYAGTPRGLERFLELSDQLATRISIRHHLRNFEFDAQFIGILKSFEQALPTRVASELAVERIAEAIHKAGGGNFRKLRKLLAGAVWLCATENAPSITRDHLRSAYVRTFGTGPNPFA